MINGRLHAIARESFEVFSSLDADDSLMSRSAGQLPIVAWPNGRTCVEANIHFNRLLDRGYSLKSGGGTLATYATHLSPLLRYCFLSGKSPDKLTDADFRLALRQLGIFDVNKGRPKNNRTTIIKIGAVWLDFLVFVGEFYNLDSFVAEMGTIKGRKERYVVKLANGKFAYGERWSHPAFPPEREPEAYGMPFSDSDVAKLREAADDPTVDNFVRQRRLVTIELLDVLGLRRLEGVLLRVSDIESALKADAAAEKRGDEEFTPSITFRSVKKRGNRLYQRCVPVNRITMTFLRGYNELRRRHLKVLGVKESPDSAFLVSSSTGKRLRANTLTQELAILGKKAGIKGRCSPHMMRHRFVTNAFIRLIQSHQLNSADDFQRMLLDSSRFKAKVMEYAGHASEDTLNRYIHLAFDQVASFKKVEDRVALENALDALVRLKERYRAAQSRGESTEQYPSAIVQAVEEIERLRAHVSV